MKGRQIMTGRLHGREAAALFVDGELEELIVDPQALVAFAPGTILRGRVNRLMKGQGGVFVTLPDGNSGYLRDRSGLKEGQPVLVQVSGIAEPGKAVPLSARILLRGRLAIATPGAPGVNVSRSIRDDARRDRLQAIGTGMLDGTEIGLILRSAAATAEDAHIRAELKQLIDIAISLQADISGVPELLVDAPTPAETAWMDWVGDETDIVEEHDALPDQVAEAAAALRKPFLELPGGGFVTIEPTRALVAIDVNTGTDSSRAAGLKANIAAARILPRQLRLRGLGGQIVIDFAPISKRERGTLDQELKKSFRADSSDAALSGWTTMGLFELSRKRDRIPFCMIPEVE